MLNETQAEIMKAAWELTENTFAITQRYHGEIKFNGKTFNTIGEALREAFIEGANWMLKQKNTGE